MLGSQQCHVSPPLLPNVRAMIAWHTPISAQLWQHSVACPNAQMVPCRQQQPPSSSKGLLQPSRGRLADTRKRLQHQRERVLLIL